MPLRKVARRPRAGSQLKLESLEPRIFLAADPIINELSASNDGILFDEDGDTPDWFELHNAGDESIDLDGWYVTDDISNLTKWQITGVTLAAGGYETIFASGKDRAPTNGPLHTNFRLSTEGESLALVEPDGTTIASSFAPTYPQQFRNITWGVADTEQVTTLISPGDEASYLVPTREDDLAIGRTWTGNNEPFDDSSWPIGSVASGFRDNPSLHQGGILGTVAYQTNPAASGSQAFAGPLGMDFVANEQIVITSLGAFDDGSNGFQRTITVELWSRDERGTPNWYRDDRGGNILATERFTSNDPGILIGGSRFKQLDTPLVLAPGAYTIVAEGYGDVERNAVGAEGGAFGELGNDPAIRYVGTSRYGVDDRFYPGFTDTGPANRYGAGSFTFLSSNSPEPSAMDNGTVVAYETEPGSGNATTDDNVGMEFVVNRPVRITELGIFDSDQDGIDGAVGVSLWSRDTERILASETFIGDEGTVEAGTGSRFLPLDTPIVLQPGFYTVVASGFIGNDLYSREDALDGRASAVHDGGGALSFAGTSSSTAFPANRFAEEAHHRLTDRADVGPINKWAAGTFKFETVFDDLVTSDVSADFRDVNSSIYQRIPFEVGATDAFTGLRMHVNYNDGFVAYLNGVEVASRNAPAALVWNSSATAAASDAVTIAGETIDLSDRLDLLTDHATNLVAIHGLNASASDADFVFSASLEAFQASGTTLGYFDQPTPNAANGTAQVGFVEAPEILTPAGFIEAADLDESGLLHVEIEALTPDAQIVYTLDGSEPTLNNGVVYSGPVSIESTVILRAAAFKDGFIPSRVATGSYLFLDDILRQSGTPQNFPSHWNGAPADYGLSQDPTDLSTIVGDPNLSSSEIDQKLKDSLLSLPTMSISLDIEDLFGTGSGIYTNPFPRGRETERPASVEYFLPDGTQGFQVDAGLRMMGWTSRIPFVSPKHSLRLVFRDEYGPDTLEYPLFPDSPVQRFDTLALRSNSRDTWIADYPFGLPGEPPAGFARNWASYIRDEWSKTLLADVGRPAPEGTFVHLYLNGLYWGIYNPTERPNGAFAAEHFGGQEDDYDAVTFCNPTSRSTHGDLVMWDTLVELVDQGLASDEAFQRIQGNNPDGTLNPEFDRLIDLENYIDYMIAGQYDAADDWPCNFYAIRERAEDAEGFKFITWDNDLGLPLANASADRTDIDLTGTPVSSPWRFQSALELNTNFRLQYADQVHEHLFNDGALTVEQNIARWQALVAEVRPALEAESARWGDYRRDVEPFGDATLYNPTNHFDVASQFMVDRFFGRRDSRFLDQLRSQGLYPDVDAPSFNLHGGDVDAGFQVDMTAPAGTIYYTLDGSDPREHVINHALVSGDAAKRVLVPTVANGGSSLGTNWTGGDPGFDDSGWRQGTGGVGFEADPFGNYDNFYDIDVGAEMFTSNVSAYVRIPFDVNAQDLTNLDFMKLNVRYDDGFVAYLNGRPIASANAPPTPGWNTAAVNEHPDQAAMLFESFDVSAFANELRAGENVLAIHGFQTSPDSSDFLITAELVAGETEVGHVSATATEFTGPITLPTSATVKARVFDGAEWSAVNEAIFHVDNGLRVTELNYNPIGAGDPTEFIELMNTSSLTVDLTGVHFDNGIQYEFLSGDANLLLDPGEFIVIVADPAAFVAAYPDVPATSIAQRPYEGRLNNGGEEITLVDAGGGITQEFTYEDSWYPITDGGGKSLNIVDQSGDLANWDVKEGWVASTRDGGTPGSANAVASVPSLGDRYPGAKFLKFDDRTEPPGPFGNADAAAALAGIVPPNDDENHADAGILQRFDRLELDSSALWTASEADRALEQLEPLSPLDVRVEKLAERVRRPRIVVEHDLAVIESLDELPKLRS